MEERLTQNWSINRSINRSINQWNQWTNQLINQSINQWTDQSINQSINRWTDQLTLRWIEYSFLLYSNLSLTKRLFAFRGLRARNRESGKKASCARQTQHQSNVTAALQKIILQSDWPFKTTVLWTILASLKREQGISIFEEVGTKSRDLGQQCLSICWFCVVFCDHLRHRGNNL